MRGVDPSCSSLDARGLMTVSHARLDMNMPGLLMPKVELGYTSMDFRPKGWTPR